MGSPSACGVRRPFVFRLAGLAAVALALACGDAAGDDASGPGAGGDLAVDPRCEGPFSYEACGGDLEGTWTVDYACGDRRVHVDRLYRGATEFDCWIPADISTEVRGTVTYRGDVEISDLAIRSRALYTIPDTCIAALEPDVDPALFCERYADRLPADGRVGGCDYDGQGCVCDFWTSETIRRTAPFQRFMEVIVEFPGDEDAGFSYCVQGDRMVQARDGVFLQLVR